MNMNKLNCLPNVIIAGVMRCGTTSLFRYLSAHPDVFIAAKKELNIFYNYKTSEEIKNEYASYFQEYKGAEKILLEASPKYMRRSTTIPKIINEIIPEAKIILIFRNPIERIQSVYKALKRSGTLKNNVSLNSYVESMLMETPDVSIFNGSENLAELSTEIERGRYSTLLGNVLSAIPHDQIYVGFVDSLSSDPMSEMKRVCEFLELDSTFYNSFQFHVENPTINAKWPLLYRIALNINVFFEPILNRTPSIRRAVRNAHHVINKSSDHEESFSENTIQTLWSYYADDISQLGKMLSQIESSVTPSWITEGSAIIEVGD